ncbi:hypothetical protein BASA61_008627 [Batrachochytrium salamandrivorans]|nr:hypothetical protein BASA61_008627 [Batrachochytrium salamandrivorans]
MAQFRQRIACYRDQFLLQLGGGHPSLQCTSRLFELKDAVLSTNSVVALCSPRGLDVRTTSLVPALTDPLIPSQDAASHPPSPAQYYNVGIKDAHCSILPLSDNASLAEQIPLDNSIANETTQTLHLDQGHSPPALVYDTEPICAKEIDCSVDKPPELSDEMVNTTPLITSPLELKPPPYHPSIDLDFLQSSPNHFTSASQSVYTCLKSKPELPLETALGRPFPFQISSKDMSNSPALQPLEIFSHTVCTEVSDYDSSIDYFISSADVDDALLQITDFVQRDISLESSIRAIQS